MLFSKPWQRAVGLDPTAQAQMYPATYAVPMVAYLVMSIAVGMLAVATGSTTLAEGVALGLVVGIGLGLAHTAVDATFDPNKPQPWVWFAINGSYHALRLLIVALIVSVWR